MGARAHDARLVHGLPGPGLGHGERAASGAPWFLLVAEAMQQAVFARTSAYPTVNPQRQREGDVARQVPPFSPFFMLPWIVQEDLIDPSAFSRCMSGAPRMVESTTLYGRRPENRRKGPLRGRVIFQYFASRLGCLGRRLGRAYGERNRCAAPEQAPLPISGLRRAPGGCPALPQAVARPTRPRARPPRAGRPGDT